MEEAPGGPLQDPVLLYDKLKLRGYGARTEKKAEGDYLVRIAPAWALDR